MAPLRLISSTDFFVMLFSIIIPVYKVEKYLHQCVDSVLCQSYQDFELILVDDGSPDACPKICDNYSERDERVKVIHQKNAGLSEARNSGTNFATGEYIVYLDSDDYISNENFLYELSRVAKNNVDVICYRFDKLYESTNTIQKAKFNFPRFKEEESYEQRLLTLVISDAFYCSAWSKAIRRELIYQNNIKFKSGIFSEDQEWYYKVLLAANSIDSIDESFVVYRQREGSISKSFGIKNLTDTINLISEWKEILESNSSHNAMMHSLAKLYCNLLIAYCSYKNHDKLIYLEKLRHMAVLFRYNKNPRVRKMSFIYRIVGFRLLLFIIELAVKIKA